MRKLTVSHLTGIWPGEKCPAGAGVTAALSCRMQDTGVCEDRDRDYETDSFSETSFGIPG